MFWLRLGRSASRPAGPNLASGHPAPGEHHRVRVRLRDGALASCAVRQIEGSVSVRHVVTYHSVLLQHESLDVAGVVGRSYQYDSSFGVVGGGFEANPTSAGAVFPGFTVDLLHQISSPTRLEALLGVTEPTVGHGQHLALKGGEGMHTSTPSNTFLPPVIMIPGTQVLKLECHEVDPTPVRFQPLSCSE